jgi:hypothetical protein
MKQSDIFTIVIIALVGTLAAFFGVSSFLGDPDKATAEIKTVQDVSASLTEPDSELFNPNAINPTVEVYVGNCEDIDHNGILSQAELIQCNGTSEDANDEEQPVVVETEEDEETEPEVESPDTEDMSNMMQENTAGGN